MRATICVTVLLALAACDKTPAQSSAPAQAPQAPQAPQAQQAASAQGAAPGAQAELKEGDLAPTVDLALHDGKTVKLSSFAGKSVAVYFYPRDNTPGCTVEAQGLRDQWAELQKAGVEVIGVSTQDAASHKAFAEQEKLPFALAVDVDGKIAAAFGVPLRGGLAARQTFLIGKDGKVKKVWRQVTPKGHAEEILASAR